jgi:hypothetical protein
VNPKWKPYLMRFGISMALAFIFGFVVSEVGYRLVPDNIRRQTPERFELVIPLGTAERIAAGETVPALPENMTFLQGDVLVVVNQDVESHQLGPIWVPPNTSGSLLMDTPQSYSYACTFQPSQYLGLDVRSRLTAGVRLQGVLAISLPTGILIGLYAMFLMPYKGQEDQDQSGGAWS